MMIVEVINHYAQEKTGHVEYYPGAHDDSEIHAEQNGNLERHEISKIEDRVRCRRFLRYSRPSETFSRCGRMLQGTTDQVEKQAEQRISSRCIKYVPGHDSAKKKTQRADAMGNLKNREN